MNPHQVTRDFEKAVAAYTCAPYAVAVNSCTNALFLCLMWYARAHLRQTIEIPKRTYVSVPMQILHAGFDVAFRDEKWSGVYELSPTKIYDAARRFTTRMYIPGSMMCVSIHASKILGVEQGGLILHSNPEADAWFRKARFDGRTEGVLPKDDTFDVLGFHMYLSPSVSAQALLKLHSLAKHNEDLRNDDYPDLSQCAIFNRRKVLVEG
jgi:dTDP-4-amino-4,6-dideoxygalactose transaminase